MMSRTSVILACVLLSSAVALDTAGGRAPVPIETRTYRFKARIKDNGGVTPFKVKDTISGKLTYDIRSEVIQKRDEWGHYKSKRNAVTFECDGLIFDGAGEVMVAVGRSEHAEQFIIRAPDLKLPTGWDMDHKAGSQGYSVLLQNAPPKSAIRGIAIPTKLSLSDFTSFVEVRLDFSHGVSFPGGAVKGRATVLAVLEDLDAVRP